MSVSSYSEVSTILHIHDTDQVDVTVALFGSNLDRASIIVK
jgi:hypothetical protein